MKLLAGLKENVDNYIKNCQICQKSKNNQENLDSPLVITETPNTLFEKINIHVLNVHNRNSALTIRGELSQAYPVHEKSAKVVVDTFLIYLQHYMTPLRIHYDYGREFNNTLLRDRYKVIDIKLSSSSLGHPQSNGFLERIHSTLLDVI